MYGLVLAFGLLLMLGVLVSEHARRTVLSVSVIFLVAGFVIGDGVLGWVASAHDADEIRRFAELAIVAILFVEGTGLPLEDLRSSWRLPGRALLLGMPLTIGAIALAGWLVLDLTWIEALVVGAILSPTDPVFATAIIDREAVPLRVRRLLRVESGLNDGIALPIIMVLFAVAGAQEDDPWRSLLEAGAGVAVGVALPALFFWLERRRFFAASAAYEPLSGIAIAAALFGLSQVLHINEFLAAFAGGITMATMCPDRAAGFRGLGHVTTETLKLATLLLFGTMLTLPFLFATGWLGVAFAVLVIALARPAALAIAMIGARIGKGEWLAVAWFGPKGFASLVYAVLMLHAGLPRATLLFQAIALVVVLSIVAHTSTSVAVATAFEGDEEPPRGHA